jgi:hypothetical protein
MPDDTKRADDERWARAQAVLDKVDDEGARIQQRRIKRRFIGLFVGLMVVLFVLGLVLALLLVHADESSDDRDTASVGQGLVGLGVIVAGLAIGAVGLFKLRGSGQLGGRWGAPTAMLTRRQRKSLARQVRGKESVDRQHLAITRDLAERILANRWLLLTFAGLSLSQAGGVIQDPSWSRFTLFALIAVLYAFASLSMLRFARQAERFLAANPMERGDQ